MNFSSWRIGLVLCVVLLIVVAVVIVLHSPDKRSVKRPPDAQAGRIIGQY